MPWSMTSLNRAGALCARRRWRRCLILGGPGEAIEQIAISMKDHHRLIPRYWKAGQFRFHAFLHDHGLKSLPFGRIFFSDELAGYHCLMASHGSDLRNPCQFCCWEAPGGWNCGGAFVATGVPMSMAQAGWRSGRCCSCHRCRDDFGRGQWCDDGLCQGNSDQMDPNVLWRAWTLCGCFRRLINYWMSSSWGITRILQQFRIVWTQRWCMAPKNGNTFRVPWYNCG